MKIKILFPALVGAAFVSATAGAAVVYSENFDGLTVGSDDLTDSSSDWSGSANQYSVAAADGNFSSNNLLVGTTVGNFNFANWSDGTNRTLLTISFDIADPGTTPGAVSADAGIRVATSRATSNASLVDITRAGLADNTVFHYDIVSNISGAAVTYEDGTNIVAATSYDVWVNGVQTVAGATLVGNGTGDIDGVGFWAKRAGIQLNVDNFEIRDTAYVMPIPEPSVALLGLCGLGFLARRKRAQGSILIF